MIRRFFFILGVSSFFVHLPQLWCGAAMTPTVGSLAANVVRHRHGAPSAGLGTLGVGQQDPTALARHRARMGVTLGRDNLSVLESARLAFPRAHLGEVPFFLAHAAAALLGAPRLRRTLAAAARARGLDVGEVPRAVHVALRHPLALLLFHVAVGKRALLAVATPCPLPSRAHTHTHT